MSDPDATLGALLRSSSVALYLELDRDDRVVYANAHASELFGRDVCGQPFSDLLVYFERRGPGGIARAAAEPRLVSLAAPGGLPLTYRCHFIADDDRVRVFGAVEPRSLDLMQRTLVTLQRDLVNETRQLQRTNAELARLAKTRDTFFGMAAHDLRTPLATIVTSAQLLQEDLEGRINSDEQEALQWIRISAELMRSVVDGFLSAALSSAGQLRLRRAPTDLGSVANEALVMLRRAAEQKRIVLIPAIAPDLPLVSVDRAKISQVLINLLRNAIEHSSTGHEVTVVARFDERWVTLEVRDQGTGIPPELQSTLFEAYAHGTNKTAGERSVGLGLALSKLIVDAHEGELAVESEPGRGTTFNVRLPRN